MKGKLKNVNRQDPMHAVIDASDFADQITKLATTITYSVEREGPARMPHSSISFDIAIIIRQLIYTYKLILYLNADERRDNDTAYQQPYSFVILPLVRTMIDGLYNCTAMLDAPGRARVYRISGYYRMREAIKADEMRFGKDPNWKEYLTAKRAMYLLGMRLEGFSDSDLNDKANEWPLLGKYLGLKPDTPHRQMLRKLTLGFWKEYSSISHASYDGLISIFPFIGDDLIDAKKHDDIMEAGERHIATHLFRTAAILLCLLTEIQYFYKFDGPAEIDCRLGDIWMAMLPVYEVNELYVSRYRSLLKKPLS